jgi:hypothetical protein
VLYITNKTHLFAIAEEEEQKVSGEATEAE